MHVFKFTIQNREQHGIISLRFKLSVLSNKLHCMNHQNLDECIMRNWYKGYMHWSGSWKTAPCIDEKGYPCSKPIWGPYGRDPGHMGQSTCDSPYHAHMGHIWVEVGRAHRAMVWAVPCGWHMGNQWASPYGHGMSVPFGLQMGKQWASHVGMVAAIPCGRHMGKDWASPYGHGNGLSHVGYTWGNNGHAHVGMVWAVPCGLQMGKQWTSPCGHDIPIPCGRHMWKDWASPYGHWMGCPMWVTHGETMCKPM